MFASAVAVVVLLTILRAFGNDTLNRLCCNDRSKIRHLPEMGSMQDQKAAL